MKPRPGNPPATQKPDDGQPYQLDFHREVSAVVAKHGTQGKAFRPQLDELFASLKSDPKQYEKKQGALSECRAAKVRFNKTAEWRCVFTIDEECRFVKLLALGPHDQAYRDAESRI